MKRKRHKDHVDNRQGDGSVVKLLPVPAMGEHGLSDEGGDEGADAEAGVHVSKSECMWVCDHVRVSVCVSIERFRIGRRTELLKIIRFGQKVVDHKTHKPCFLWQSR